MVESTQTHTLAHTTKETFEMSHASSVLSWQQGFDNDTLYMYMSLFAFPCNMISLGSRLMRNEGIKGRKRMTGVRERKRWRGKGISRHEVKHLMHVVH